MLVTESLLQRRFRNDCRNPYVARISRAFCSVTTGASAMLITLALILLALPHHVMGQVCQVSGTSADCRGRGLTSVPSDLPPTLTSLDLSDNEIRELRGDSFRSLEQLTELTLRGNKLSGQSEFLAGGAVFQPLAVLQCLDLGGNQLTELVHHSFSGLQQLQRLLLDHNLLRRLQPCAFCGLASLRHLGLQANQLRAGSRSYPDDVFSPLRNLTILDLSENSDQDSPYPEGAMTPLTLLESLTLDLLSEPLPEVLSTLQNLTSLTLKALEWTRDINNVTLSSLAEVPLRHLLLTGQDLYSLHRDALQPVSQHLQQLEVVDLPSLSLPVAIAALHVLAGRNMSLIRLEGLRVSVAEYYNDTFDRHTIDEKSSKVLRELCVERLSLAKNAVMIFETAPLYSGCLANSLKQFDFSGNYLGLVMQQAKFLENFGKLEYVDLSTERAGHVPSRHNSGLSFPFAIDVRMPPKLSYLNISHSILSLGRISHPLNVRNASHLRTIDVSYCGMTSFDYPVRGLESVTTLNVSGNDLMSFNPFFTDSFKQVKDLSMRDVSLDPDFLMRHSVHFFASLNDLERVDLSENRLHVLPRDIFKYLKEVRLSENYFSSIPLEVDDMPRLVTLDLSFNSITLLTSDEREQLDARAQSSKGHFRLLLEGNPLTCDCSDLDFVSWLSSTSVRLDRGGNYSCLTDGGVFTNTAEVVGRLEGKWRQCVGGWWLGMASACLLVTLLTLALVFFLTRFWTNVQHVTLRMLGFGHVLLRRVDFRYDVYVAYSDEDYRFACFDLLSLLEADGLRVYVRDRDEPVGESRAGEVVRAVGKSWRIVFVLTEAFLRDEWCQFTALTAARCSASPHGPGRVLLVLLRPLPRAHLPPSLLTVVEEQDVFDLGGVPPGPLLWGRLLHRIREP